MSTRKLAFLAIISSIFYSAPARGDGCAQKVVGLDGQDLTIEAAEKIILSPLGYRALWFSALVQSVAEELNIEKPDIEQPPFESQNRSVASMNYFIDFATELRAYPAVQRAFANWLQRVEIRYLKSIPQPGFANESIFESSAEMEPLRLHFQSPGKPQMSIIHIPNDSPRSQRPTQKEYESEDAPFDFNTDKALIEERLEVLDETLAAFKDIPSSQIDEWIVAGIQVMKEHEAVIEMILKTGENVDGDTTLSDQLRHFLKDNMIYDSSTFALLQNYTPPLKRTVSAEFVQTQKTWKNAVQRFQSFTSEG